MATGNSLSYDTSTLKVKRCTYLQGVKTPGREADHSPPSSVEVKNGGAIPPFLLMPSWHSAKLHN
jgi:hypothetical protein